jgi:hypothetical protein
VAMVRAQISMRGQPPFDGEAPLPQHCAYCGLRRQHARLGYPSMGRYHCRNVSHPVAAGEPSRHQRRSTIRQRYAPNSSMRQCLYELAVYPESLDQFPCVGGECGSHRGRASCISRIAGLVSVRRRRNVVSILRELAVNPESLGLVSAELNRQGKRRLSRAG